MDEKQYINEIAKIICKSCFDSKDSVFDCNASEKPCQGAVDKAEKFYNAGFRIIPQGAVVLTAEQRKQELKEMKAELLEHKEFVKQVKEKIIKFAEQIKMRFYYHFDEIMPSIMAGEIDNILKEEFGVDMEKTVCPVCGQKMDETYHGRHYCKNCEDELKGKNNVSKLLKQNNLRR